jgi:hypothetical protein
VQLELNYTPNGAPTRKDFRIVIVTGGTGSGKTTMLEELLSRATEAGCNQLRCTIARGAHWKRCVCHFQGLCGNDGCSDADAEFVLRFTPFSLVVIVIPDVTLNCISPETRKFWRCPLSSTISNSVFPLESS